MDRPPVRARFVLGLAASAFVAALVPYDAQAQTPERRLAPSVAESIRIPAGIDSGTPATSNALPLGTPVPPNASADRVDQRTRSAAARAAARPVRLTDDAAPVECLTPEEAAFRRSLSECSNLARRGDRASCAADAAQARKDRVGDLAAALPAGTLGAGTGSTSSRAPAIGLGPRSGCV